MLGFQTYNSTPSIDYLVFWKNLVFFFFFEKPFNTLITPGNHNICYFLRVKEIVLECTLLGQNESTKKLNGYLKGI